VLKHLRLGAGPTDAWRSEPGVESPFYWRREAELYASGVLDGGPFRPPACLSFERADGSVALWLEDVGDPEPWPLEDIADVASRLAALRTPSVSPPWLARGWLRRYLEVRAGRVDPALPVWQRREQILERIEGGPPVLVHNDFHPGNIFRTGETPVVIDWAFCGLGVPGEDAGILAADFLFDGFWPLEDAELLIAHVWAAYSSALEPALVPEAEFAYFAGNALRYAWAANWNERFATVYRALTAAAGSTLRSGS
jgi:aminoglycoside phosphotransferase (APT) family kinase protein